MRITIDRVIRAVGITARPMRSEAFIEAMMRVRTAEGRYRLLDGRVELTDQTLFRADVILPANLTEGEYKVRLFLLRGGGWWPQQARLIGVRKEGLERLIFNLAQEQPLIYGLLSLVLAAVAGWAASAVRFPADSPQLEPTAGQDAAQPFFLAPAVSSASSRAFSASFSSRAFWAMARTASNSSRVTKSRSAIQRSTMPFIAVSASVLAPWATPMALVISWLMSSKNLLRVCIGASCRVCPIYGPAPRGSQDCQQGAAAPGS